MDNPNTFDRSKLEKDIRALLAAQEVLEAAQAPLAKLLHQRFQCLQDAGFTAQQALEIIKTRGLE